MLRIFGFGRKPSPPPEAQAPPQVNPTQQAKTPPRINVRPSPSPPGQHSFQVKTRISKAVGKEGRYACHSVRALPSVHKGEVILQATDGHQATCVITQGHLTSSRLVPASVLPSRQSNQAVAVRLIGGQWESTDGRAVEDKSGDGSFPSMGDVLPVVGRHPFHETTAQSEGNLCSLRSLVWACCSMASFTL